MLKAITIVTCLTIIFLYIFLLILTYPSVCWIKHRPSDIDTDNLPPLHTIFRKQSTKICQKEYQLNLIPMPHEIILLNQTDFIRIPKDIHIQSNKPLPFSIPKSASLSSFVLSIDYEEPILKNFYPDLDIDESYQLNFTSQYHVFLSAKTYVGIIRGFSTFEQLQRHKKIPFPLVIIDKPKFIWRGLMLDVARHFIPISIIKQTIDHMQLVKLNVLHLHLSDDQAFRLESKQYPKLHDPHEFYTQSDMQNLIDYARLRAIRIVPEFDMPAHTTSWFVSYPQLSSKIRTNHQVAKTWGVHNATMDVTLESTYDFVEKFFAEMTQLFPDRFFHIGGDECVPYEWLESESIRKFMEKKRMYDQHDLQAYFTRRVEKLLQKFNRTMMGWDEISISNLSNGTVIQSWRDKASLINSVRQGYSGILSHGFYLDHMSSSEYHYNNDLDFDLTLNKIEQKRVLGGEACLWTEYISSNMVHSRLWPRTAAIAERFWSSTVDQIECMYDRLNHINKKFFHPNDEQYIQELSTLTSNPGSLKVLADACEPLGLQGRDRTRNYTSDTPLNRFVDLLKPESEQLRYLLRSENLSLLYSTFISWKQNHLYISSNDTDILQLSGNLFHLGEIGIHLLKFFDKKILSLRWYYYQQYLINTLEYQVPEIRLAGVKLLQNLLREFSPCSFDLINLCLILFFPLIVIIVQRVNFIRRRILLPCLNFCYQYCARF